jgi:hypothetical protein
VKEGRKVTEGRKDGWCLWGATEIEEETNKDGNKEGNKEGKEARVE